MKKIPTLFQRDPANMKRVRNVVVMGCEWVAEGEGIATRKYDGACCAVLNGRLFKRREVRKGKIPTDFSPVDYDPATGKHVGWVPVGAGPDDQYFREGIYELTHFSDGSRSPGPPDGTFELCGPKINKNPEGYGQHTLIRHAHAQVVYAPRTFEELREHLEDFPFEGIVWHHSDGRMVKIKRKDFHV